MSISAKIIARAATQLHIPFEFLDEFHSVVLLHLPGRDHLVMNTKLGLISHTDEQMGRDKEMQYRFLHQVVAMPKTRAYLDFNSVYGHLARLRTLESIEQDITAHFTFPLIIKRNQGTQGAHVFFVEKKQQLATKIAAIFHQHDTQYDFVALAQEYIKSKKEYRVVMYNGRVEFVYEKNIDFATFVGNLSPLHYEGAQARLVTDQPTLQVLSSLGAKVYQRWKIAFAGLDVFEDEHGGFWLIEVNTAPSFAHFVKDNGEEIVYTLFRKILLDL